MAAVELAVDGLRKSFDGRRVVDGVIAPILAAASRSSGRAAATAVLALTDATSRAAAIPLWRGRIAPRGNLRRRHRRDLATTLLEAVLMLACAGAVYLGGRSESATYAIAPAVVAGAARSRSRTCCVAIRAHHERRTASASTHEAPRDSSMRT